MLRLPLVIACIFLCFRAELPALTLDEPSPTTETGDDQEFQRQRAKSKAEAAALYPDVADHKTPLGKEVDRLIESYKVTDAPILYAPDAPMLIALVAARNLSVAAVKQEKGALTAPSAVEIEGKRMLKQAAEQGAKEAAEKEWRASRTVQIAVAPMPSSGITFKLPSEIEADKKAEEIAKVAARKVYCEAHPVECETLEAAKQAKQQIQSLQTTLFLQGGNY